MPCVAWLVCFVSTLHCRHVDSGLIQTPDTTPPPPRPEGFQQIKLPQNVTLISGPLDPRVLHLSAYQSHVGQGQVTHDHMAAVVLDIHSVISAALSRMSEHTALPADLNGKSRPTQVQELRHSWMAAIDNSNMLHPAVTRLVNARMAARLASLASLGHAATGLTGPWEHAFLVHSSQLSAEAAGAVQAFVMQQFGAVLNTECAALQVAHGEVCTIY